jgi:predicted DNA-binding protein
MTTIQVPDKIANRYEELARAAGRDMNDYIREALVAHLYDIDDIQVASERLKNPQPTIPLDEVKQNLGLDD